MPDLAEIFSVGLRPAEMVIRGTAIYWFIFFLFRYVLRRDVGSITIADVLLLVLIADASSNAMSGNYQTVTDGIVLISTIAFWNYLLDWAAFHFPRFRRLIQPPPEVLVRDGQVQRKAMRRELITMDELWAKLREHEIAELSEIKIARLEDNGEITIERVKRAS